MTPKELAQQLTGDADTAAQVAKSFVRPTLRKLFPRQAEAKGTNWQLEDAEIEAVTEAFEARQAKNEDEVEVEA